MDMKLQLKLKMGNHEKRSRCQSRDFLSFFSLFFFFIFFIFFIIIFFFSSYSPHLDSFVY